MGTLKATGKVCAGFQPICGHLAFLQPLEGTVTKVTKSDQWKRIVCSTMLFLNLLVLLPKAIHSWVKI